MRPPIVGTPDGERIYGTADADTIYGVAGFDRIYGRAGDDEIYGGVHGIARIYDGPGSDACYFGTFFADVSDPSGNDSYNGSRHRDFVSYALAESALNIDLTAQTASGAEIGFDRVFDIHWVEAGAGDDVIKGTRQADTLHGNGGNNRIFGGGDSDTISGSKGSDTINGGSGDDNIYTTREFNPSPENLALDIAIGGAGKDCIVSWGSYASLISGGPDKDMIMTGRGNDTVHGGTGDDEIRLSSGFDVVSGGTGEDKFKLYNPGSVEPFEIKVLDFEVDVDKLYLFVELEFDTMATDTPGGLHVELEHRGSILFSGVTRAQVESSDNVYGLGLL